MDFVFNYFKFLVLLLFRKYYENKTHREELLLKINKEFEYLPIDNF